MAWIRGALYQISGVFDRCFDDVFAVLMTFLLFNRKKSWITMCDRDDENTDDIVQYCERKTS